MVLEGGFGLILVEVKILRKRLILLGCFQYTSGVAVWFSRTRNALRGHSAESFREFFDSFFRSRYGVSVSRLTETLNLNPSEPLGCSFRAFPRP